MPKDKTAGSTRGAEIKGIDQIFPKKPGETNTAGNLRLWIAAGVVAALAAGYALIPDSKPKTAISTTVPPVTQRSVGTLPPPATASISRGEKEKAVPAPPRVEEDKAAKRLEAKIQLQEQRKQQQKTEIAAQTAVPESKAATTTAKIAGGRSCDCEVAELNLPAVCPDASCRQCKASCGIPGN
jgi:type IV secretory pathway VirB10-like protein